MLAVSVADFVENNLAAVTIYADSKRNTVHYANNNSQERDFREDVSIRSSMTTDESETEEEIDHWIPLIEAKQK